MADETKIGLGETPVEAAFARVAARFRAHIDAMVTATTRVDTATVGAQIVARKMLVVGMEADGLRYGFSASVGPKGGG